MDRGEPCHYGFYSIYCMNCTFNIEHMVCLKCHKLSIIQSLRMQRHTYSYVYVKDTQLDTVFHVVRLTYAFCDFL